MIIVFPMLTEPGISKNIIPAISKVLERFVIVYRMDEIFKMTSAMPSGSFKMGPVGGSIGESQIAEAGPRSNPDKGSSDMKGQSSKSPDIKVSSGGSSKTDAKIDRPNQSELMLEPTYITLTTKMGPRMVGVKVLPFPVKSGNIIDLMRKDVNLTGTSLKMQKITRMLKRAFKFSRRPTVSGDVFSDVVMANTKHKANTFLLINHAEMDTEFSYTAAQINKLHKLGWSSFAFADDVNKRAMFCMKEFSGLCSTIPYSFMLTSFSKDQNKAFDDLEDARRSSAPFFSRKNTKIAKIVGEKIAQSKINDEEMINEGILDFAKKVGSKLGLISSAVKSKDEDKIDSALKSIPDIKVSAIRKMAQADVPEFNESYNLAHKVVKNSMDNDTHSEIIEGIAIGIATKASMQDGDVAKNTRDELRQWLPTILRSAAIGIKTAGISILALIISGKIGMSKNSKISLILILIGRAIYKLATQEQKELDKKDKKELNKKKVEQPK